MSLPTRTVTDKTTLYERRGWSIRQDAHANKADPRMEIVAVTDAEKEVLAAAKKYLGDYKTHRLSVMCQSAVIKDIIANLKIPRSKVRHMLKNVPKQIMFRDAENGEAYLALVPDKRSALDSEDSVPFSHTGVRLERSTASPSSAQAKAPRQKPFRSGQSTSLFEPMSSSDEEADDVTDGDTVPVASTSRQPPASEISSSAWGIQVPKEQQRHKQSIPSSSPAKPMPFQSSLPRRSTTAERNSHQPPDQGDEDDGSDLLSAIRNSQSQIPTLVNTQRLSSQPTPVPQHHQGQQNTRDVLPNDVQPAWERSQHMAAADDGELDLRWGAAVPASISQATRPIRVDSEDEEDFDMSMPPESDYTRRSGGKRSHQKTSSGGGSSKRHLPAIIFDGHSANRSRGRSTVPMPPGLDDSSTRDSSQQDGESTGDDVEAIGDQKPKINKGGPTRPGTVRNSRSRDGADDDSDDDVIVVTSVRVGSAPSKTLQEREAERDEKRREREIRKAAREAERLEKEKLHEKRRRNPLPNFRHTQEQEMQELKEVYQAYLAKLHVQSHTLPSDSLGFMAGATVAETGRESLLETVASSSSRNASWTQCFSYESGKSRLNRPDYNSVQFWPYNLPFPGRRRNEAIVAMAGGSVVRVFRLTEERGISELWNAVDESSGWENEDLHEDYFACAWTYELRNDRSVNPLWRKWPIICVAGRAKEVKILDGYSGTLLKVLQGHGGSIFSLAVHPSLPHVIATASADEVISLWDISVSVAKPEIEATTSVIEEKDKRRKGYAEDERLCVFGGFSGHVEAVLSIAFHPSLPFLASAGADCKVRIWKVPNILPEEPTSCLTDPQAIDPPERTSRPPSFAFPVFIQDTLHSHHIDHVQWIGHEGHLLTRSLCFDGPGKRVLRVFRPKFFDTLSDPAARPADIVGFDLDFPSDTELVARWTTPACTDAIGDGVVCVSTELVKDTNNRLYAKRRVYVPTLQPALHTYDVDIYKKQEDLAEQLQKYPIRLGAEMLFEDDLHRKRPWRAVDCQPSGRGWLIAVGEGEKLSIWKRKLENNEFASMTDVRKLLIELKLVEDDPIVNSPRPNNLNGDAEMSRDTPQDELPASGVHLNGAESADDDYTSPFISGQSTINGVSEEVAPQITAAEIMEAQPFDSIRSPSVEYVQNTTYS